MKTGKRKAFTAALLFSLTAVLFGCASSTPYLPSAPLTKPVTTNPNEYRYLIGPGDSVNIFVWRNQEVSTTVTVRPDGLITTPLVEDLQASNLTPTQLARNIENKLSKYIKNPIVTVTVDAFVGPYTETSACGWRSNQSASITLSRTYDVARRHDCGGWAY